MIGTRSSGAVVSSLTASPSSTRRCATGCKTRASPIPPVEAKLEFLHLMNDVGIHGANIGLPGSSPRAFDDVVAMCQEITAFKLTLRVGMRGAHRGRATSRR